MKIISILFPVDFSDRCAAVVPYVAAAGRRFGASVKPAAYGRTSVDAIWPYRDIGFPRAAARQSCG